MYEPAELEKVGIPGLLEVLREEGTDGARYVLLAATYWHRCTASTWRNRITEEEKHEDLETEVAVAAAVMISLWSRTTGN